jgi:energy-coupling factor transporter ATP-binding protein EcfA2
MIHIDRSSVRPPTELSVGAIDSIRKSVEEFFDRPRETRLQETFEFDPFWQIKPIAHAVNELFHFKCAFCELPCRDPGIGAVDQFRPRSGAVGLKGEVDPDHYWWLAYEWRNLYLVCSYCSRNKGNRFPVSGSRALAHSAWTTVDREPRLLLDPCADEPSEALIFHPDGLVSGISEAGTMTVEMLSLNRSDLVAARRDEYGRARSFASSLPPSSLIGPDGVDPKLVAFLDAAQPYAAARRQAVNDLLGSRQPQELPGQVIVTSGISGNISIGRGINKSRDEIQQARDAREHFRQDSEGYSLADAGGPSSSYFLTSRTIERIEIRNFRLVRDLRLEFPKHEGGWLMLLGENATGKSTILQAVALTLMGQNYRDQVAERLGLDASRYVRHGAQAGSVRVWLNGLSTPCELIVRRSSSTFEGSPPEPKALVVAYGATRLLPRHGFEPADAPRYADVENIFNPFEPLSDATTWLLSLRPPNYEEAARALKTLLPLKPADRLIRKPSARRPADRVQARFGGVTTSLDELSDGYQSVVALAADAIRVMLDYWSSMESAEGIIAIDELGAHLHPRWKMQIVQALRTLFPRVQFLATTHDPLCLRGLRQGEVVVLRRVEGKRLYAITDLPPIDGLRADQLLTSEHFGLSSTLDPTTDAMFETYYALIAKRKRTTEEQDQLDELKSWFKDHDLLGRDRRERLMLEAIDQYLADARETADAEQRKSLRAETLQLAKAVYAKVPPELRADA